MAWRLILRSQIQPEISSAKRATKDTKQSGPNHTMIGNRQQ
jgi:hypothetical protein